MHKVKVKQQEEEDACDWALKLQDEVDPTGKTFIDACFSLYSSYLGDTLCIFFLEEGLVPLYTVLHIFAQASPGLVAISDKYKDTEPYKHEQRLDLNENAQAAKETFVSFEEQKEGVDQSFESSPNDVQRKENH